jgi:hypothetical protein
MHHAAGRGYAGTKTVEIEPLGVKVGFWAIWGPWVLFVDTPRIAGFLVVGFIFRKTAQNNPRVISEITPYFIWILYCFI